MIIDIVSKTRFCSEFIASRPEQFSYEALELIYDYLDDLSDDTNEPIEFDPIAISCDYVELTYQGIVDSYSSCPVADKSVATDEGKTEIIDWLTNVTQVIGETSTTVIFAEF